MKQYLTILLLFIATGVVEAQDFKSKISSTGKSFRDFIPKGYDTLSWGESIAIGDLNKDGFDDIVLVLRNNEEEKLNDDAVRSVVIIFKQNDGYKLACVADSVVMCKGCGGIFGDPFDGVFIKNGILIIRHYGGSAWRWSVDMKFRFQNGTFYLIGETKDSFWINSKCDDIGEGARDYIDMNFVTGDRIRKKTAEDCKVLLDKKDRIKVKPLVKMADVNVIDN